jgi:hypothetical protein
VEVSQLQAHAAPPADGLDLAQVSLCPVLIAQPGAPLRAGQQAAHDQLDDVRLSQPQEGDFEVGGHVGVESGML